MAQASAMARLMQEQADATIGMTKLLGERIGRLEVEVAALKAVRDGPSEAGTLQ
jgi:hypothetical protein